MNITTELKKMKQADIWSLMLFVLYKFQQIPEYSSISELAYILDQKNLLKLCEYFGGQTLKIPTIDMLEEYLYAMLVYQYTDIEKMTLEDAIDSCHVEEDKEKRIKHAYKQLKEVLSSYEVRARASL